MSATGVGARLGDYEALSRQSRHRCVPALRVACRQSFGLMQMRVAVQNIAGTLAIILVASIGTAGDTPLTAASEGSAEVAPARPFAEGVAPSIQSGGGFAACLAWSDGCITCTRVNDAIACSTPGIACLPATARCLEAAPATPEKPNDTPQR